MIVLVVIGAPVVLANLSSDTVRDPAKPMTQVVHGWPFVWHWYNIAGLGSFSPRIHSGDFSAGWLAANLLVWLVALAAPAASCEWALRRYRPGFRWSLRAMFVAVALAAACCGWYSNARNRADVQDPLLTAFSDEPFTKVWLERTGPEWLDLVGADRLRRYIIGARIGTKDVERYGATVEGHLLRISRLPKLRSLSLGGDRLTPAMIEALSDMRQLRELSLSVDRLTPAMIEALDEMRQLRELRIYTKRWNSEGDAKQLAHDCLVAIGKMPRLERLHMEGTEIAAESLACLAGLKHLKSLSFDSAFGDQPSLFTHLPALPNLETIDLDSCQVSEEDLRHLATFPRLRSLGLRGVLVGEGGLADVACLKTLQPLEELALDFELATPESLETLQALKHLKTLHFKVWHSFDDTRPLVAIALGHGDEVKVLEPEGDRFVAILRGHDDELEVLETECDRFVAALRALRQSKPGIVVDADTSAICWQPQLDYRSEYSPLKDTLDRHLLLATFHRWLTPLERARYDADVARRAR
ncbi:MAG TPA: hypothetical protein VJ783_05530 [Pirellulales bacterium]|nr:hypothetical protein [Pirellulales bacterium]